MCVVYRTRTVKTYPHYKFRAILLGQVALVHESRNHMRVFQRIVVMRSKDIGWNDGGEMAAILLMVGPLKEIYAMLATSLNIHMN